LTGFWSGKVSAPLEPQADSCDNTNNRTAEIERNFMLAMLAWATPERVHPKVNSVPSNPYPGTHIMNDTDFLKLTGAAFSKIEQALEQADLDYEQPADGILEVEFGDGSKIVINRHTVAQEIWVAARSGGFHFRHDGQTWRDTRDNSDLFAKLTELVAAHGGNLVFS
jgi:CyaY protein